MSEVIFTSHKFPMEKCPPNLKSNLTNWKNMNPTYEFKYFCDELLLDWMKKNIRPKTYSLFQKLNSGAGKADLFRICYLFYEGGIWVDADLPAFNIDKNNSQFKNLLKENKALIVRNRKCDNPRYTFIASTKKNILFFLLINKILQHIEWSLTLKHPINTIHVTGPFVLHKLVCELLKLSNIKLLPLHKKHIIHKNSFMYIDDFIPEKNTYEEENTYKGYQDDLRIMKTPCHRSVNAVIVNVE